MRASAFPPPAAATLPQSRPHRVLAAPSWAGGDLGILDEDASAAALLLWQCARDARLWAATEPERRTDLFSRGSGQAAAPGGANLPAEIAQPLAYLSGISQFPAFASDAGVAGACAAIAEWAAGAQKLATAACFAEAASLAEPGSAGRAAAAGYLCFRRADFPRAAIWYDRAIALARRSRDWVWYIRGHLRLGILLFQLGEHDRARPLYLRAARMAVRTGRRTFAAQAIHDLLTLESDVGTFAAGEAFARRALALYPLRHPRVAHLAHDYCFLLIQNGYYAQAAALLDQLSPTLFERQNRVILWGSIARAAAGMRHRDAFEQAARRVLQRAADSDENAASALLHVAEGARVFQEWDRAEQLAARALDLAVRRGEGTPHRLSLRLLDELCLREPAAPPRHTGAEREIAELSRLFVQRVKRLSRALPGARLGRDLGANLSYCAGSGQGTITRPPDPI
ncbi:MAG TPA: hypothetical protein VNP72_03790, partial [Longimicrobium sp.]|nr:hypothetical protein [Longimicrobium sp.]